MSILGDIFSLGVSAFTGGATGLIGMGVKALFSWLGEREKRNQRAAEMAHEIALITARQGMEQAQADADYRKEVEITAREKQAGAERTRQASYMFANFKGSISKTVAGMLSLFRPAMTAALLLAFFYMVFKVMNGTTFPINDVTLGLVYLTSTAVTWWFGDRPPQSRARD